MVIGSKRASPGGLSVGEVGMAVAGNWSYVALVGRDDVLFIGLGLHTEVSAIRLLILRGAASPKETRIVILCDGKGRVFCL